MKPDEDRSPSSVWEQYRTAKKHALEPPRDDSANAAEAMTLEELEAAIAEAAAASGIPETGMPPRSVVHPAKRRQLSRWFYRALLVLFTALVAGLLWWGTERYGAS